MIPQLPKKYFRRIWRAIGEFKMLDRGESLVVGLSGGKDSCFLLYAMAALRLYTGIPREIFALTVDMGFSERTEDFLKLNQYCKELNIPFYLLPTKIGRQFVGRKEVPCAMCSYLRRGAMARWAQANGHKKIAYAHHLDDIVETFIMNIFYAGKNKTFLPKSFLERTGVTVIRPLVYLREYEISHAVKTFVPVKPIGSLCPFAGRTKRAEVKNMIKALEKNNKFLFSNLCSAMRSGPEHELWPPKIESKRIKEQCNHLKQNSTSFPHPQNPG